MKIPVTNSRSALVDECDFKKLSRHKWCLSAQGYAVTRCGISVRKMHQFIVPRQRGKETDHIDRNKLNNRRGNLRVVTHLENARNASKRKDNHSGYIGVYFNRKCGKWVAQGSKKGKPLYLGLFRTPEAAARSRDQYARKVYGTANFNFVE